MDPIRVQPFGTTRSCVTRSYALITPDTHVSSPLVGWQNTTAVVHIAPEMGARFTQYTAILGPSAKSAPPGTDIERFMYVLDGAVQLNADSKQHALQSGQFAFVPSNTVHELST